MSEPSRVALAQALLAERPAPVLLRQLDTLLTWLGNPDNPAVTTLDAAIKQTGQERSAAAGRAYALLDGFLFVSLSQAPATTLGLDPETNIQAAKLRYRRLIQAYHPDRHPDLASVLNDRLERINVAYAALQQGAAHPGSKGSGTGSASPGEAGRARTSKSGPSEGRGGEGGYRPHAAATTRTPKQPRRPKRAPRSKPRHHRSWVRRTLAEALRQSFGDASSFQTRFFGGLIIVCALVLALHYYQTPPLPTPAKIADIGAAPAGTQATAASEGPEPATPEQLTEQLTAKPAQEPTAESAEPTAPLQASIPDQTEPSTDVEPELSADPAARKARAQVDGLPDIDLDRIGKLSTPQPLPSVALLPEPETEALPVYESMTGAISESEPARTSTPPPDPAVLFDKLRERIAEARPQSLPEPAPPLSARVISGIPIAEPAPVQRPKSPPLPVSRAPSEPRATEYARPTPMPIQKAPEPREARDDSTPRPRPQPVARPATPLVAQATTPEPLPTPAPTPAPKQPPDPCESVDDALSQFRSAYNAGAVGSLLALYAGNATENQASGAAAIGGLYRDWFAKTSRRRIQFPGVALRADRNGHCRASVRYSVSYRDADGRNREQSGNIRFVFQRRGQRLEILSATY